MVNILLPWWPWDAALALQGTPLLLPAPHPCGSLVFPIRLPSYTLGEPASNLPLSIPPRKEISADEILYRPEITRTAKSPHHRYHYDALRRSIYRTAYGEGYEPQPSYAGTSAQPSSTTYQPPNTMTQLTGQNGYNYGSPNGHPYQTGVVQTCTLPNLPFPFYRQHSLTSAAIRFPQSPFYDVQSTLVVKTLEGTATRSGELEKALP